MQDKEGSISISSGISISTASEQFSITSADTSSSNASGSFWLNSGNSVNGGSDNVLIGICVWSFSVGGSVMVEVGSGDNGTDGCDDEHRCIIRWRWKIIEFKLGPSSFSSG